MRLDFVSKNSKHYPEAGAVCPGSSVTGCYGLNVACPPCILYLNPQSPGGRLGASAEEVGC